MDAVPDLVLWITFGAIVLLVIDQILTRWDKKKILSEPYMDGIGEVVGGMRRGILGTVGRVDSNIVEVRYGNIRKWGPITRQRLLCTFNMPSRNLGFYTGDSVRVTLEKIITKEGQV